MGKIKIKLSSICSFIALLCMVQYSYGQAVGTPYIPESRIPFSFLSGGANAEAPISMDKTADGGYIVIGSSNSSATGDVTGTNHQVSTSNTDWWVVKYSSLGKLEWQRLYGGNGFEEGTSIKQTSDGGYIATGSTSSNSTGDVGSTLGGFDFWVVKLTANGNITWQKNYGGSSTDFARTVLETSDGYIVAGRVGSTNIPGYVGQYWVFKLDYSGNTVWQKTYANPGPNRSAENMYAMAATSDGSGYVLVGSGTSDLRSSGGQDAFIMKINLTGVTQWKKLYGGSQVDYATAVSPTSDGGSIVVAISNSSANGDVTATSHGDYDMWILRLDISGNVVWQQLYGGNTTERAYSVQQTADGGFIVAGTSYSSASGNVTGTTQGSADLWILKLTSTGTIQWQRLYGGSGLDAYAYPAFFTNNSLSLPAKIIQTTDGGYIVAAGSTSSLSGDVTDTTNTTTGTLNTDYWLFKLDASGNIVWVPNVGQ